MTSDGVLWEHGTPARLTNATASGGWQSPTVQDANGRDRHNQRDGTELPSLLGQVRLFPTPNASDGRKGPTPHKGGNPSLPLAVQMFATPTVNDAKNCTLPPSQANHDNLVGDLVRQGVSGQLNPTWVEWLMGWPLGWTALEPLAMDKFLEWQRAHGGCWEGPW